MSQDVRGEGHIPLKPRARAKVAKLAEEFDGWLQWDRFELTDAALDYAYDDNVTIGTAGRLDDFFDEIAAKHAKAGWAHYGPDDEVTYYGPTERARLEAETSDREAQLVAAAESLELAKQRLRALG
jgi:hypothetical protein